MSSSGTIRRDDALVAVAAGHLVADRELALLGDEDLDQLDHAGRQLVAAKDLVHVLLELAVDLGERAARGFHLEPEALVDVRLARDRECASEVVEVEVLEGLEGALAAGAEDQLAGSRRTRSARGSGRRGSASARRRAPR